MTPEEAAAAAAAAVAAAAEEAAKAAGAGSGGPPGMEEAAEAVVKSSLSFAVVIIILLVCASLAAALVYLQRKRHETFSLLSGLDNRYEDILDRLQEIGDHFDDTVEKAAEEPSTLEKRNALIKRAAAVIPIVRIVQQEMQQKQVLYREGKMRAEDFDSLHRLKGAIDEETEVIRQIAEEINPGFGQRIFSMVASSQHFQLLFMMDSNNKAYETALTDGPDKAEQKLLLLIHRAMPCFDYLKQMKGIPIEALHKDGKISLDEYECFMGVKYRLEEEKKAVEAEAVRIDPQFKVFHVVMGPQQQLFKMCMEADRIVRSYDAFIEKTEDELTPRQRFLSLILRKGVPMMSFDKNLAGNAVEAQRAHEEGRLPLEVYEALLTVKKRIGKRLATIKEEANVLIPSLGDKLEHVWEKLQPYFRPVLVMEATIDKYEETIKKDDSLPQTTKLTTLVEKRVLPARELEGKVTAAIEEMEMLYQEGRCDELELEVMMAIKERVAEELQAVREEGFEIMGPDYDVLEKEDEKEEKRLRARKPSAESTKERLKQKVEEKKQQQQQSTPPSSSSSSSPSTASSSNSSSSSSASAASEKKEAAAPPAAPAAAGAPAAGAAGRGGEKAVNDDLAAKVAEAERIAAELMAEESSSSSSSSNNNNNNINNKKSGSGGGGGGGREGGKEGGSGSSGSGKKKKTPKA